MKCREGFLLSAEVQQGFLPKLSNVSGRWLISALKSQCESNSVDRPSLEPVANVQTCRPTTDGET